MARDLPKVTQLVRDGGASPDACSSPLSCISAPDTRVHVPWETGQLRAHGCRAAYGSRTQTLGKVEKGV